MNILWTARTKNRKTGDVPTAWIGNSVEEAFDSCSGCKLRKNGCYAWSGSVQMGFFSLLRAMRRGKDYSIENAIDNRHVKARMLRLSAIGDIGRCDVSTRDMIVDKAGKASLKVVGYTHHWREEEVSDVWKGVLMASCESEKDADLAVSLGWRSTMIVPENISKPFITKGGNKAVVCPAQTTDGKVQCNDCLLCNASLKAAPIVAFQVHGTQAKKAIIHSGG